MRHFYIFNINDELININKTNPYILFKTLDSLYNLNKNNINYGISIYKNLTKPINKNNINSSLFKNFKKDVNYTKFMYNHFYNNYYSDETSNLYINNSYIKLDTTSVKPSFFNFLNKYNHFFVCDFENKDFFWLESIA